jgi:hypothetical protein
MQFTDTEYEFLGRLVMERSFSVSKTGVDQKIFSSWKRHNIIPTQKPGKWAKANFVELVWIRMLETMRRLNCSVATMQKVYYHFFVRAWEEKLADKNRSKMIAVLKEKMYHNRAEVDELYQLHILETVEQSPELKEQFNFDITYLYELLGKILLRGGEGGILIDINGDFREYYTDSNGLSNISGLHLIQEPMIIIPISHIITDLLYDNYGIEFLSKHQVINEDEMRVIKELRNENVASITVSKGEDEPLKISANEKGLITGEQARKIMQILGIKNYSSIELKTRNNSTLSFIKSNRV